MFAPHHQASADELVRVCRPDGTIGLLSWTPQGFIGQMFAAMKPYVAPPPPGAQPPPLWGDEAHVRALLGDQVTEITARRETVRVDRFAIPEQFRDYFKARYGPTIAAYRGIADEPERIASLDQEHRRTRPTAVRRPRRDGLGILVGDRTKEQLAMNECPVDRRRLRRSASRYDDYAAASRAGRGFS